jgi:hypothetical protein
MNWDSGQITLMKSLLPMNGLPIIPYRPHDYNHYYPWQLYDTMPGFIAVGPRWLKWLWWFGWKWGTPKFHFESLVNGLCKGISQQNMALYGTVPPFWDPVIPIELVNHHSWWCPHSCFFYAVLQEFWQGGVRDPKLTSAQKQVAWRGPPRNG